MSDPYARFARAMESQHAGHLYVAKQRRPMRKVVVAGILAAGAAVGVLAFGNSVKSAEPSRTITCYSTRVTDGDTLRCNGERVRLDGIDAPEHKHPGAERSTESLRAKAEGRLVSCTVYGQDRYGRSIGRCSTGAVGDLGSAQVRNGSAKPWRYGHERKPYAR